jgi:hypothetical protein
MPEVSCTELEFDTATQAGLDGLIFLLDTDAESVGIPPSKLIDHEFGVRQDAIDPVARVAIARPRRAQRGGQGGRRASGL